MRLADLSGPRAYQLFLAGYLIFAAIILISAPLPQMVLPWEAFVFYDGGWRVWEGFVPHVDFYSPLGPLTYLIAALGMLVTGGSLTSLAWALFLTSVPLALASWYLLSRRLTPWLCVLVCLYIVGTWLLPFAVPFGFRDLTYGGLYNRQSHALLVLLVFLLLFPRFKNQDRHRGDMVMAGVLLALLLATKLNFFLIACLFVALFVFIQKGRVSRCGWIGIGFISVLLPLLAYLHFDLMAVARDFVVMTGAHSPNTYRACLAVVARDIPVPAFFNLAALLIEARLIFLKSEAFQRRSWHRLLLGRALECAIFEGAQILAILSNAPEGGDPEIPLLDIYGLIQAQRLAAYLQWEMRPARRSLLMTAIFGAGYPLLRTCMLYILGYGFCLLVSISHSCDFYFIPMTVRSENHAEILRVGNYGYDKDYVKAFEEGKTLLARHVDIHQVRINTFDETNPYPFAFRSRPPPGRPIALQEGRNVTLDSYPAAAEFFKDCDCILIPKGQGGVVPSTTPVLLHVYGSTLRNQYSLLESGLYWDLYVKRTLLRR